MPEIDILLASYNGEKYIAEQIESILSQTFTDWRLLIRDDGSTDNTPAIIESYAEKYPGKIEVVHDDKGGGNLVKNFFELLGHAEADYVMFCDQDDYWLPEKIRITLERMKEAEYENPDTPVMIFTGLELTDEKLRSMKKFMAVSIAEFLYTFDCLIISNCVSGCTEMLNRPLYSNIGEWSENISCLHDHWTAIYASAFGTVCHVSQALVLYRQHSGNQVGRTGYGGGRKYFRVVRGYMKRLKKFLDIRRTNTYFRQRYSKSMPPTKLKQLDDFLSLMKSGRFRRLIILLTGKYPLKCSLFYKIKLIMKCVLM